MAPTLEIQIVNTTQQSQTSQQRSLCDLDLDEYQRFVESHRESTIFHHRCWLELLCDQHGFAFHIPALKENGRVVAAIPFLETRSIFGNKKLVSLPFTDSLAVLAQPKAIPALNKRLQSDDYREFSAIVLRTHSPTGLGPAPHAA